MTIGVNFLDITNVSLFPKKRPKGQKMFHFSTKKRVFLLFPIFFSNLLFMKIPLFMVAPEVGWLLRLSAGPLHAECSFELFGKARLLQRGFFFTRFPLSLFYHYNITAVLNNFTFFVCSVFRTTSMLFGGKPRSAQKRKVEVPLHEPCLRCKELQALLDIANKTIKIMSVQIAKEAGKSKDVQFTGRHLSTASASFFGNEPSSPSSSWGAYPEAFDIDKFGSEEPSARAVKPQLAKVVDKPNVKAQEAAVNVDKPKFDNIDLSADGADAVDAIIAQHQLDKKGILFLFFCFSFCSRFTLFAAGGV